MVGEPQHAPASFGQPAVPDGVAHRPVAHGMRVAIDLDNQLRLEFGEVEDVGSARVLPPELGPGQPAAAQGRPELAFGGRRVTSKPSGSDNLGTVLAVTLTPTLSRGERGQNSRFSLSRGERGQNSRFSLSLRERVGVRVTTQPGHPHAGLPNKLTNPAGRASATATISAP